MPITISTKGGVRLRGLDLLLALRRLEPQKAAVVLRELVAMGFTVGDLGISVAEIDRFVHGRPALRLIRGGKRSGSQSDSNPSVSGSSRNPTLESKNIERDESRITAAEHEFVERGSALPVEASLARDARSLGRAPDASLGYPRGSGSLRRSTQRVLIVAVVVRGLCGDSQPEAPGSGRACRVLRDIAATQFSRPTRRRDKEIRRRHSGGLLTDPGVGFSIRPCGKIPRKKGPNDCRQIEKLGEEKGTRGTSRSIPPRPIPHEVRRKPPDQSLPGESQPFPR
jgi:hypothetical protein